MNSYIFDRISFWSLFAVVVLLPVFFLPFTRIPVEISKGLLLVVGLAVSVIFWVLARFSDAKVSLPRSSLLLAGLVLVLFYFASSFFSASLSASLFGTLLDVGSAWFFFVAFSIMLLSAIIFNDKDKGRMVLLGVILSATLLLVFQILHSFAPSVLSFGVLNGKTSNVLGSWNAVGFFAAFSALLALIVIEFFSTTRSLKILSQVLIVLSLLGVAAVNFSTIWILLGVFSLIIFVYKIATTYHKGEEAKTFPIFSFVVVTVCLLFLISGQFIGAAIPRKLGLATSEVGPSMEGTLMVAKEVIKNDPILGLGPNRYMEAWALYKPQAVNTTVFWGIAFGNGFGALPTFLATGGILGILVWLLFLLTYLFAGYKVFFHKRKEINWDLAAFFILSLFLFMASFFYFTGLVILLLAFVFTGIFIGNYAGTNPKGDFSVSFLDDTRKSFAFIFILLFIIIGSAALSFKYGERFAAYVYFSHALAATATEEAEASIRKAVALSQNDVYLRAYAQVYLVKLNALAAKGSALSETEKSELQTNFNQALSGAQAARQYDPKSYLNHRAVGLVYQNVATLGVKDASSRAIEAYSEASKLNPLNPGLKLLLAQVALTDGKTAQAKDYATEALTLKPNYVSALIVLSQIARREGDRQRAITYATQALALVPDNADIAQYVDSLKRGENPTPPDNPEEEVGE